MLHRAILLGLVLASNSVLGQLRPRRVGGAAVNAMGQQEDMAADPMQADAGLEGLGADSIAEAMKAFGGEGGMPDMEKMMEMMGDPSNLADNPLLKGLAESNPEVKEMLSNPEKMKDKMAEAMQMMQSEEGQGMAKKMMEQMSEVLTDPEKLQEGLQQLATNPALKGLADSIPGLKDVINDPEKLQEQASQTAALFQKMQDPEQAQASEYRGALMGPSRYHANLVCAAPHSISQSAARVVWRSQCSSSLAAWKVCRRTCRR